MVTRKTIIKAIIFLPVRNNTVSVGQYKRDSKCDMTHTEVDMELDHTKRHRRNC